MVHRNGILERLGTALTADLALTSWKLIPSASGASNVRTVESPKPGSAPCARAPLSRFFQRTNICSRERRTENPWPWALTGSVTSRTLGGPPGWHPHQIPQGKEATMRSTVYFLLAQPHHAEPRPAEGAKEKAIRARRVQAAQRRP